jgi:hypothetical protein
MRIRTKIIVACICMVFLITVTLFILHINKSRIVARVVAPDGTEFCVVQTCNWNLEFFNTSCYYRKPAGRWGWFYYDHQDWYWRRGRAEVDTVAKRISIYRGNKVTATFDWESEKFRLLRPDIPQREYTGAQELMPKEWNIAQK